MSIAPFDFKNPDYAAVFRQRTERLIRLRNDPKLLEAVKVYYKNHPAHFISDWGMTFDPRNVERGLPSLIPFILFPRQVQWVQWLLERWRNREPGITEKTRDMGMSWLSIGLACTLGLFNKGLVVGVGSRKEEYVDRIGDPKSIFEKGRIFLENLPVEFRGGWALQHHAPHMRIIIPETDSIISGEAGDGIGRGARASLYLVDESAFLERPAKVDASLSQTTNCRQDISTPNGMSNSFAQRRFSGKIQVFTFHWHDDPRKDQAWYDKQVRELDPVTVAQEIDINYSASVEGVVIPSAWVTSAVDAHAKLKIEPSGRKYAALDVADEGIDSNAHSIRHGVLLYALRQWSGKGSSIFATAGKAIHYCEAEGVESFLYDADGLGSGIRGDAAEINSQRVKESQGRKKVIAAKAFRGSGEVLKPEQEMVKGRKNKDFFANLKAQSWWHLRLLFQKTHQAVTEGRKFNHDEIISLDSSLAELPKLRVELSQPTYSINTAGKIVIDKQPDGLASPNLADAVMMVYSPASADRGLVITTELLKRIR